MTINQAAPPIVIPPVGVRIAALAEHFAGLQESIANAVWDDPATPGADPRAADLREVLIEVGWKPGWPYCMSFAEGVWRLAGAKSAVLALLTPHVMTSFRNCKRWVSPTPVVGAIGFMQKGKSADGHAFLVTKVGPDLLSTVEGNTSPAAGTPEADREGDGVYKKSRRRKNTTPHDGLWIRGYLHPFPEV
jgi:hypothetical protein